LIALDATRADRTNSFANLSTIVKAAAHRAGAGYGWR
jgi:hypothetical protein